MAQSERSSAPSFVRYWTKADKVGFWPRMVCPLLTQSGHGASNLPWRTTAPIQYGRLSFRSEASSTLLCGRSLRVRSRLASPPAQSVAFQPHLQDSASSIAKAEPLQWCNLWIERGGVAANLFQLF